MKARKGHSYLADFTRADSNLAKYEERDRERRERLIQPYWAWSLFEYERGILEPGKISQQGA